MDKLRDLRLKGYSRHDIIKGSGCSMCTYKGYVITTYRDEVRDEETYWTCVHCLDEVTMQRIKNALKEAEADTNRQKAENNVNRPLRAEDV
jgi:hypothetical protein